MSPAVTALIIEHSLVAFGPNDSHCRAVNHTCRIGDSMKQVRASNFEIIIYFHDSLAGIRLVIRLV